MAFFKFRKKGKAGASAPATHRRKPDGEPSLQDLRLRARYRLIGAVILVAVAVIGFPLVFDTEPRDTPLEAPIVILDRGESAPAPPVAPIQPVESLDDGEELVVAEASAPAPQPAPEPAADDASEELSGPDDLAESDEGEPPSTNPYKIRVAPPDTTVAALAAPGNEPRAAAGAAPVPPATGAARQASTPRDDDAARARAALEGRSVPAPAVATAAGSERFVVQVGAFAEDETVSKVRQQVERAGLKTYIQVIDTSAGKRTRVRVGPYNERAQAERAAQVLQKAGLPGQILSL